MSLTPDRRHVHPGFKNYEDGELSWLTAKDRDVEFTIYFSSVRSLKALRAQIDAAIDTLEQPLTVCPGNCGFGCKGEGE